MSLKYLLIETKSHNLCLGKFYIIRSQEKNSNQNRDSNLGPPNFQPGAPPPAGNPEVRGSNPGSGSNFSLEIL